MDGWMDGCYFTSHSAILCRQRDGHNYMLTLECRLSVENLSHEKPENAVVSNLQHPGDVFFCVLAF